MMVWPPWLARMVIGPMTSMLDRSSVAPMLSITTLAKPLALIVPMPLAALKLPWMPMKAPVVSASIVAWPPSW